MAAIACGAWQLHRVHVARRLAREAAWRDDSEAQRGAADVLDALTSAPAAERLRYARQVVQILKDFPDKAIIQHKGCVALESICRAQHGNVTQVQAAGAVPVLLAALERHRRVRAVQHAGLGAIACLSKVAKNQIFDLGGIATILGSMSKFKRDPTVQVSGAMALAALCLSSSTNRRSVSRYGGIPLLIQALEKHHARADVLIAASETLALLAEADAELRKQIVPSLSLVQGLIARCETRGQRSGADPSRLKDFEAVLRSLRKLEAMLYDTAFRDHEAAEAGVSAATREQDAAELQEKIKRWSSTQKKRKDLRRN